MKSNESIKVLDWVLRPTSNRIGTLIVWPSNADLSGIFPLAEARMGWRHSETICVRNGAGSLAGPRSQESIGLLKQLELGFIKKPLLVVLVLEPEFNFCETLRPADQTRCTEAMYAIRDLARDKGLNIKIETYFANCSGLWLVCSTKS